MEGDHPKCAQVRTVGEDEKSIIRYIHIKWMVQTNFGEYIGSTKNTRASAPARKMSLFSFIIITIILSYAIIRIQFPSIFESPHTQTKNRHSIFLKEIFTQMFV